MGYEANFNPPLDDKYKCPVCLCALKDPIQTKCGHRLCSSCFKSIRGGNWYFRCPIDNTWSNHAFEDNAVQREVLSLNVKCNNECCDWNGELRELQNHVKNCEYEKIKCPKKCNMEIMRIELTKHELECPQRLETCQHCDAQVIAAQLARHHVLLCPKFPVKCPTCGEVEILRENVNSHINIINGDCPKIIVPCSFRHIGCMFEDKRIHMSKHYVDANTQHLMLLSTRIVDLETKNRLDIQVCTKKFQQKLTTLYDEFAESEKKNEVIEKELDEAKKTISQLKNAFKELKILVHSNEFMHYHHNRIETKQLPSTISTNQQEASSNTQTTHETNRHIYEWKIDLTSKRKAFFSPSYCLPNSGYMIHLWLKPEIKIDDNDYYSTICVILESCDNEDQLPVSFDCCFFLTDLKPSTKCVNTTAATTITSTASNVENLLLFPKQLKSFVTTDPFHMSGHVSKPMILYKSSDFYSFIVDNMINLEFTIRAIKEAD